MNEEGIAQNHIVTVHGNGRNVGIFCVCSFDFPRIVANY